MGLTRMASDGEDRPKGSKEYNHFWLVAPRHAVPLDVPITIQDLRDGGCDPACFRHGTQGTLFPVEPEELDQIVALAVAANPHLSERLMTFSSVGSASTLPQRAVKFGGGFGDSSLNPLVEQAAVRAVTEWYIRDGWTVRSVERECIGYDLVCRKGVDERHVEVKGVSGDERSFIITAAEVRAAKNDSAFELALVLRATTDAIVERYNGAAFLAQFTVEPVQFRASAV